MSDAPIVAPMVQPPPQPRRLIRIIRKVSARVYAVGLLAVLALAGAMAFRYIYTSTFHPLQTPKQVLAWPARDDVGMLRDPSITNIPADDVRAPLSHFHMPSRPVHLEINNGCTLAGCHQPLPHTQKMKVPAFANLHVSFMACQACHADSKDRPLKSVWMNLQSLQPQEPPAALRLIKLLGSEADKIANRPAEIHPAILSLLRQLLNSAAADKMLSETLAQLESAEPGSPVWCMNVKHLTAEIPSLARSTYSAKIIPEAQAKTYRDANRQLIQLGNKYLAAPEKSAERTTLNDSIHKGIAKKLTACAVCHAESPGRLDYASLGYSSDGARELGNLQVARIMEQIREGREFRLPSLMTGVDRAEGSNAK
jgi:hypothetical protein